MSDFKVGDVVQYVAHHHNELTCPEDGSVGVVSIVPEDGGYDHVGVRFPYFIQNYPWFVPKRELVLASPLTRALWGV